MFKSLSSTLPGLRRAALSARPAQPFASTSSALFSSAASTSAPKPTTPARAGPRGQAAVNGVRGADELAKMFDGIVDIPTDNQDDGSLLSALQPSTTVGPRTLSPTRLLQPYPSRPDFTKAHPLGPPTSAALTHDPFIRLGLSPLASPMNVHLRADFCTGMGKILSRGKTSLQRSSQRKMAKAVRRARSMGIVATFGKSVPTERGY